jgi:hypothetical protein
MVLILVSELVLLEFPALEKRAEAGDGQESLCPNPNRVLERTKLLIRDVWAHSEDIVHSHENLSLRKLWSISRRRISVWDALELIFMAFPEGYRWSWYCGPTIHLVWGFHILVRAMVGYSGTVPPAPKNQNMVKHH